MGHDEISDLLLGLYKALPDHGFDDYVRHVFRVMQTTFEFDSGWIGHGQIEATGALNIEGVNLFNQPAEKLIEYREVAHLDRVAHEAIVQAGMVHACSVEDTIPKSGLYDPIRTYSKRHDVQHTLCLALLQPRSNGEEPNKKRNFSAGISLARSGKSQPFNSRDQRMAALLMPHFAQARLLKLRLVNPEGGLATGTDWQVITGLDGCVAACPDEARHLIQTEWREWQPPVLPCELLEGLKTSSRTEYLGRHIAVSGTRFGNTLTLRINKRSPDFFLTPAQREVVKKIVDGMAYKEVAKSLNLSDHTVRNHLAAIYKRLGIRNKTELANRWRSSPASRL